ncbi:MAG: copper chaperone PCu(A)C [Rhodanobacteraceae bacterium]|nr:MAG: copper chaperone PCu(A)C [Rhodanobacteraceae bacterium]
MRRGIPLLAGFLFAIGSTAIAATPAPANVRIEHAWIRWLPVNLPAAGYAVIVNDGDAPVRLVGSSSPDYRDVMLMQSRLADQDSTMVKVTHIDAPAHGRASLAPGGYHIMLSGPIRSIKPGDKVPMTLHFASGATLQVDFSVLPANAVGPSTSD